MGQQPNSVQTPSSRRRTQRQPVQGSTIGYIPYTFQHFRHTESRLPPQLHQVPIGFIRTMAGVRYNPDSNNDSVRVSHNVLPIIRR